MPDALLDLHAHAAYIDALAHELKQMTGQSVERIETHISSLLLTPQTVYKFKKPVCLPFADFSTPQQREHCCREELRLNRRLAPQLYLEVLPVTGTPSAPRLGCDGPPIDHAVCMRRFPADALLSKRLEDGRLEPAHIDLLARKIARFHAAAPCAAPSSGFATPDAVMARVQAVLKQLDERGADTGSLKHWVAAQGEALWPVFEQRRATQAIRECHGDLHLSNIVFLGEGEVTAFDGIEFDPALRWIDVMDDLAFATMDLKARGQAALAWRLLDVYLQERGDHAGLQVLRFYEVGRALVRALVGRLAPAPASVDYLACAHRLARDAARNPGLAVMCGLSGSGKSSLAGALLEIAGAVRLRSDVERKRLFGFQPLQRSGDAGFDLYTDRATRDTFDRLRDLARQALLAGYPVIVDAAFLLRSQRETFRRLADELRRPFTIIHCTADVNTLRQRVARRAAEGADPSEATPEVIERQLRNHEPPGPDEQAWTLAVDTTQRVDAAAVRWQAARSPSRTQD